MEIDRHTYYIAASYGMVVIAIIIELIAVRKRRSNARQQAALMSAVRAPAGTASTAPEAS